jgi:hypothetical protein
VTRIRSGAVQVEGLRELSRALKALDATLPRELRAANKAAAEVVASRARARALGLGSVAAKTAPSINASAGAQSAGVGFGGPAYPFGGGAEFGSLRYRQFQPWTGNGPDAGYFVYPTIRDDDAEWFGEYEEAIEGLLRKAGLT